jgi:DNA-binding beta-propeller fold protein YncE
MKSVNKPEDLGIKTSWFKKILNRIFGDEQSQNFIIRPYGVFADQNRLYVTDPGSMLVHIFDLKDQNYFNIQKVKDGYLQSPIGIASDRDGKIYVSDSVLKRVFVFSQKGEYLREMGTDSLFRRPAGLAVNENRLYVIDTHLHGVLVFSKIEGNFLYSFGTNGFQKGEFNYPTNIFISNGDLLYITDSMNFRVQVFDRQGNFISSFGKPGDGFGDFSKPKGIAVDSDENIYVADAHFDTVQIFNGKGELLLTFGKSGNGRGEMILPAGLFIDDRDRIYVADSYNHRILLFQYLKEND